MRSSRVVETTKVLFALSGKYEEVFFGMTPKCSGNYLMLSSSADNIRLPSKKVVNLSFISLHLLHWNSLRSIPEWGAGGGGVGGGVDPSKREGEKKNTAKRRLRRRDRTE